MRHRGFVNGAHRRPAGEVRCASSQAWRISTAGAADQALWRTHRCPTGSLLAATTTPPGLQPSLPRFARMRPVRQAAMNHSRDSEDSGDNAYFITWLFDAEVPRK